VCVARGREYTRTFELKEELGLNDMNVEEAEYRKVCVFVCASACDLRSRVAGTVLCGPSGMLLAFSVCTCLTAFGGSFVLRRLLRLFLLPRCFGFD
jgi:hypothetical protein